MLLPRILDVLVGKEREGAGEPRARGMGHDDFIDIAAFSSYERIEETILVGFGMGRDDRRVTNVGTMDDFHRTLGPHDRDFGGRPGVVQIAANVLR